MRFKKLSDKLKAIILAGVTLIPAGGCGKNELSNNPGIVKPGANVSVSDDKGDETTITEETTTGVLEENGTTAYYVSDEWGTSILDTTDVVTSGSYSSKVNGGKTTKTTPVLNETTTAYGDETTNYKDETTRLGEETTRLTEETTRGYYTTGSNKITTSKTTPKVTTNTTRGTITTNKTTTSKTTTTTTTNYVKPGSLEEKLGYKLSDIKNIYGAFSGYNHDFYKTFISGGASLFRIDMPYGRTSGGNETAFLFTALNYDYLNEDVWSKFFSKLDQNGVSLENIKYFMNNFASIQKKGDFSLYTVDPDIGAYMNKIQDAYFTGKFKEFMTDQIINGNIKDKYYNNVGVMCYMCSCDKYHLYLKKADIEKNYMDPLLETISQKALGRGYIKK